MGARELDSGDLLDWQQERGITLQPWEARCIRRLSRDYLHESHRAEKPDAQAPWDGERVEDRRERSEKQIRGALSAFKGAAGAVVRTVKKSIK